MMSLPKPGFTGQLPAPRARRLLSIHRSATPLVFASVLLVRCGPVRMGDQCADALLSLRLSDTLGYRHNCRSIRLSVEKTNRLFGHDMCTFFGT
jgi:hypothetical protein